MAKLIVIRHGETDFNRENRYQGSSDQALNETGVLQAQEAGKKLQPSLIDITISSPLKRARQTAETINILLKKPLVLMPDFRERALGVFEGLTREEAQAKYPKLWEQNITRHFDKGPTGGESVGDLAKRVFAGLERIKKDYPDKNILLVTHGMVAKVIEHYFHPKTDIDDLFSFALQNGQTIEYEL